MHIEYLYYFRDFAQNMSISKTAAQYYMTPQGISRAIHQLEKDFGVKLTSYQNNEISLTPAGEELREQLQDFLEQFEHVKGSLVGYRLAEINRTTDKDRKAVSISVTPCVSMYVSPLLDIQKPGLFDFDVKFREADIYNIVPSMTSAVDEDSFCIVSIPSTEKYHDLLRQLCEENNLVYQPLFTSRLVVMVSAYSPLAQDQAVTPEALRGHPVARYQDTVLGDALDDFVFEDDIKTITNATSVINTRIMEDQAISFAPKLVEAGSLFLPDRIVTVPTEGFFQTEFGVLLDDLAIQSKRVKEVIAHLRSRLEREAERGMFAGLFELA